MWSNCTSHSCEWDLMLCYTSYQEHVKILGWNNPQMHQGVLKENWPLCRSSLWQGIALGETSSIFEPFSSGLSELTLTRASISVASLRIFWSCGYIWAQPRWRELSTYVTCSCLNCVFKQTVSLLQVWVKIQLGIQSSNKVIWCIDWRKEEPMTLASASGTQESATSSPSRQK